MDPEPWDAVSAEDWFGYVAVAKIDYWRKEGIAGW